MKYPYAIQRLINYFVRLPSVGPKTAERYVFKLFKERDDVIQGFAQALAELKEKTFICSTCHAIASADPCEICSDTTRDKELLCIVSSTQDMGTIEATGKFNGRYHVLGGLIDTIEDTGPKDLSIGSLLSRIKKNKFKEIILALSPTVAGETTILYLTRELAPFKIKITKLARGIPSGISLEYTDEITLLNALKNRN